MQYILTQEEYDNLLNKGKEREQMNNDDLQKLCTMVADHMPIRFNDGEPMKPWGCGINKGFIWICDGCPVKKLCPYKFKKFSK